jgi:hypothetical protein
MQVVFYGYGTGWHWCYYFPLTVQLLTSVFTLYGLRYRPAMWNTFTLVKAWTLIVVLAVYVEILLPMPGFMAKQMLHLVPFRSPAWTLTYFNLFVWHLLIDCVGQCVALFISFM